MKNMKICILPAILLRFLLFSVTTLQSCDGEKVEIICDHISDYNYIHIGIALSCYNDENIIVSTNDVSVNSVVHKNKSEVVNSVDIEALWIEKGSMKFIPAGISNKFERLKVLLIQSCGLLSVSKENLKQFGDFLEYLTLHGNKITSIDDNLFEFNKNLKSINLSVNPIRFITPEFFENFNKMENIKYIGLYKSGCISQGFYSSDDISLLMFKWNSKNCTHISDEQKSPSEKLEEKISTLSPFKN